MSKSTCIIILNWNGKEDTLKCLQSLKSLTSEIIIVDNGSSDGSVETIRKEYPTCTILETGHNLGYAGGNNVGIEYGLQKGYEFFFILNNDTTVDQEILNAFLQGFENDPKVGILGAKILRMEEPHVMDHLGGVWNQKRLNFDYIGYKEEEDYESPLPLDYVCGAAIMIRRSVFDKVGLFDERFFLFWEEADLCIRAKKAGFGIKTCLKAKVWHKISASFTGGKPHAAYFVRRNRLLFIEKNFKGLQRTFSLGKIISHDLFSACLSKALRSIQKRVQKSSKKDFSRNEDRLVRANAQLTATTDYLSRRFYLGRSKKFMNCH